MQQALRVSVHGGLRLLDQRRSRSIALPASPVAAVAQLTAVHHGQVAALTGGVSAAQLSVQNEPHADAGAQCDHRKVLGSAARAAEILSHRRAVGVVAQQQRKIQMLAEQRLQGHILHGDVGGKAHVSAVHRTGQTHAHIVCLRLPHHFAGQGGKRGRKDLRPLEIQRHPLHCQNGTALVHQSRLEVGAAHINSNICHGDSSSQLCRRLPASARWSTRRASSWAAL